MIFKPLVMNLAKCSSSACDTIERPLEMRYFCSEPCNLLTKFNYVSMETSIYANYLSHQLHDDAVNSGTNENQSNQLDEVLVPQVPARFTSKASI